MKIIKDNRERQDEMKRETRIKEDKGVRSNHILFSSESPKQNERRTNDTKENRGGTTKIANKNTKKWKGKSINQSVNNGAPH